MRHLAVATCFLFLFGATAADAAPKRVAKAKKIVKPEPVEEADEEEETDDDVDEEEVEEAKPAPRKKATKRKEKSTKRTKRPAKKTDDVGFKSEERDEADELIDAPKVSKRATKKPLRNWHIAFGPNVWMASVKANVAVGAKSISTAIDFFDLQRNTKLGVPLVLEARYKRFSFVGDLLYGLIGLDGGNEVGPLMVTLDGKVSNWSFDGIGGYRVYGTNDSKLAVEARAGLRYQRTAISGTVGVSGSGFSPAPIVDTTGDFLAGARVFVRPHRRAFFTGTVDQSLFGSSTSTWSAGVDANLRISSYVLLAGGWRTLTQQKETISTVMHGPKVTLQVLF